MDSGQEIQHMHEASSQAGETDVDLLCRVSHQDSRGNDTSAPRRLHFNRHLAIVHRTSCGQLCPYLVVFEGEDDAIGHIADLPCAA